MVFCVTNTTTAITHQHSHIVSIHTTSLWRFFFARCHHIHRGSLSWYCSTTGSTADIADEQIYILFSLLWDWKEHRKAHFSLLIVMWGRCVLFIITSSPPPYDAVMRYYYGAGGQHNTRAYNNNDSMMILYWSSSIIRIYVEHAVLSRRTAGYGILRYYAYIHTYWRYWRHHPTTAQHTQQKGVVYSTTTAQHNIHNSIIQNNAAVRWYRMVLSHHRRHTDTTTPLNEMIAHYTDGGYAARSNRTKRISNNAAQRRDQPNNNRINMITIVV